MEIPIPTIEQSDLLEFIQVELKNQTQQDIDLGWICVKVMSQYGRYPEPYDINQKPQSIENIVLFLKSQLDSG